MPFDYTTAAAIARYEAIHTETLRDFAHSARQAWDELQLSKRESISLQREIRNLLGEIDVLKSSLLEVEAAPQPVNQQLVDALRACEECLTFIHGGEPLRTDVPLKLAREALLKAGVVAAPQPVDSIEGVVTGRDWRDRTLEVTFNTKVTLPKIGETVALLIAGKENNTHKHTVAILTEKWDDKTVTSAPFCIVCGESAGKEADKLIPCACGDSYPSQSYGAGFIHAIGHCPNCDAAGKGGE